MEKDENPENPDKPYKPRDFLDVLNDVMAKFSILNRERKREILKLVKKANRVRDE